nr:sulfate ABC transporter substrate-binding protein [Paenibacillus sp. GSMTC-2017]
MATVGCSNKEVPDDGNVVPEGDVTLVIGAYSVVKDAFGELLPKFQQLWLEQTGQRVTFQESYEASGTQARAIVGGFEADVAVLAMEGDIDRISKAGFITHDWKAKHDGGMITSSIVVLGTREGNPKAIQDWTDLARDGVKVLYPNPKTSGGAQWDINAIYGAGLKISEEQTGTPSAQYAKDFLKAIHANVESLDKSGRASMAAFEYGVGDVIVTYENELRARINKGVNYDIVIPKHTIQIDNPAAVVDANVDKHGTRAVAEAFIAYLHSEEVQRLFVEHGFRSVNEVVAEETKDQFVTPEGLFDITYLGGWDKVRETLYSKKGVWYQILADI